MSGTLYSSMVHMYTGDTVCISVLYCRVMKRDGEVKVMVQSQVLVNLSPSVISHRLIFDYVLTLLTWTSL